MRASSSSSSVESRAFSFAALAMGVWSAAWCWRAIRRGGGEVGVVDALTGGAEGILLALVGVVFCFVALRYKPASQWAWFGLAFSVLGLVANVILVISIVTV